MIALYVLGAIAGLFAVASLAGAWLGRVASDYPEIGDGR